MGAISGRYAHETLPSSRRRLSLFGEIVETDFDLGLEVPASDQTPDLTFERRFGDRPADWNGELVYHDAPTPEESTIFLRSGDGFHLLSFGDVSHFRLDEDHIECMIQSPDLDYLVTIQFLGHVMALWLERKGIIALHASAVATEHGAVGFLASKGGGKSTVVAKLVRAGYEFITDDILAVDAGVDSVLANPGYPHLRMEPDQIAHFFRPDAEQFELVHPAFEKRRIPLDSLGGRMPDHAEPLAALIVLDREEGAEGGWVDLTPSGAVEELLRHSFLAPLLQRLPLRKRRLAHLARIADATAVVKASLPVQPGGMTTRFETLLESIVGH